jgi:Holliday junction resolvase RusA-like endonuclease
VIVELRVAWLPPSPNQNRGEHWSVAAKNRKRARVEVWAALVTAKPPHRLPANHRCPATVDYTVTTARGPLPDLDNSLARIKPVQDALVEYGLLVDDSPRWLTHTSIQVARGTPSVHIRITYAIQMTA